LRSAGKARYGDYTVALAVNETAAGIVNGGDAAYLGVAYTTVTGGVSTDVEGKTRSGNPDMGAYEE
jgi:hypothetical protein